MNPATIKHQKKVKHLNVSLRGARTWAHGMEYLEVIEGVMAMVHLYLKVNMKTFNTIKQLPGQS